MTVDFLSKFSPLMERWL